MHSVIELCYAMLVRYQAIRSSAASAASEMAALDAELARMEQDAADDEDI